MDKYVGRKVKLVEKNYYTGEEKVFSAELLSNNNGPIYLINNEIYVNTPGSVIFPEIPEDLIAKPTLVWLVDNNNPKEQEIEASYLTDGINWKCDYIAVVNNDNTRADLNGWVTIDNRSGAAYKNAKLKLVAGDVNRVEDSYAGAPRAMAKEMMYEDKASSFVEESFFEYHLYTLERPSTIKNNQTKQIELLSAADIPIKERLIYFGSPYYFRNQYSGDMQSKEKVSVFLEIENSAKNKLGMPLPAGIIRAYKKDKEDSLQFIGEDRIDHTPRDEKIKIKMGDAFDIVAKRKQTDYRILSRNAGQRFDTEQEWEIALSNHKDHPVEVEVVEAVGGEWSIVSATHNPEKADANTLKFLVKIEANKDQVIKYRVRIRYY